MAIFNLGSINVDYFYDVDRIPVPGETISAKSFRSGLGGKGANQSVAASLAGVTVVHIGTIGHDGGWTKDRLAAAGVDVSNVATVDVPTAHAVIAVDGAGENAIVICSSANLAQTADRIEDALADAAPGDICLLQNETNLVAETAASARDQCLTVIYSAAPFDIGAVQTMLPLIDILVVNAVEADQLSAALGIELRALPMSVLITKGEAGATFYADSTSTDVNAFDVDPVDTTGAGDTFLGYFAAGLDSGNQPAAALQDAAAAAALQVTRPGTADAIPTRAEVDGFLKDQAHD